MFSCKQWISIHSTNVRRFSPMSTYTEKNRIAVVTGASRASGIGAAVCRALAEQNTDIFFTYWGRYDQELYGQEEGGPEELLKTVLALEGRGERIEADLSLPQSAQQTTNKLEAH